MRDWWQNKCGTDQQMSSDEFSAKLRELWESCVKGGNPPAEYIFIPDGWVRRDMKNERPEISLLPCPFCGGAAIVYEHGYNPSEGTDLEDSCYMQHDAWVVGCEECDVWRITEDDEPDEAVTLWNTRAVK